MLKGSNATGSTEKGAIQMNKRILMSIAVITAVMLLGSGFSFAGNGTGKGDGTRSRTRDGSCQSALSVEDGGMTLAAVRSKTTKRTKSC